MKKLTTLFLILLCALAAIGCAAPPGGVLPPHFYYNGETFLIADPGMAVSDLPNGYEIAGKLTLAEGEHHDHLKTGTKELDNKEIWANAEIPGWLI
jgi:hypothetical protein